MKRAIDLAGAIAGIALLWPVGVLVALLVKLDSAGPAIFSQTRVGRDEVPFRCHKFRSMYVSAPERPTHESTASDVTRVGRVLRKLKLDELPQLINVLLGEMSLVGPRPGLPSQPTLVEARRRRGVHRVRPGVTGLAQLHGIDMSKPERLAEVDALYIANATFLDDLRLIVATLPGGRWLRPPIRGDQSPGA